MVHRVSISTSTPSDVDPVADWIVRQGATLGGPARALAGDGRARPGFPSASSSPTENARGRAPSTWPDGHRSRLVQVSLDIPHGRIDEEKAFWSTITGWPLEPSSQEEFAGHLKPGEGGSLQLLLQELGPDDPATTTRAHLDLGADDREAEVARLEALGAQRVSDGRGWVGDAGPGRSGLLRHRPGAMTGKPIGWPIRICW